MTTFQIDIVSDTVCPWCFIGSRKLNAGIALYRSQHPERHDSFKISWNPFQLNPQFPAGRSIDKRSYYGTKYGATRLQQMERMMQAAGDDVGIKFKFGGKTGNSRDSHRLVELGKRKGEDIQNRVVEELFKAFFENEQDITHEDVLVQVAVKAGLQEQETQDWLRTGKGGAEVDREVQEAANVKRITGVPHFTLQGRYQTGGATEPESFVRLFEKISQAEEV